MKENVQYSDFYFEYLGYNFRHIQTGETLTKCEYFKRFGAEFNHAWELIPYEPRDGWETPEDKEIHLQQVKGMKKAYVSNL